jgi:hypothetical protein
VIEGLITFVVGVIAIFTLQDTPAKTKRWLDEKDKRFLQLRTKFLYGGGAMGAKDEFRWPDVVQAIKVRYMSKISASKADVDSPYIPGLSP